VRSVLYHPGMERRYFTQLEAQAKVSQRIRTTVPFSGVPEGSSGKVISADSIGKSQKPGEPSEVFDVAIQWELPRPAPMLDLIIAAQGEVYVHMQTGKPLVDWFTKREYDQYLLMLSLSAKLPVKTERR
jgi:hypothetical protein